MTKLDAYLKENRSKCFKIGEHDCFTFTNQWWKIKTGSGFASALEGQYSGAKPQTYQAMLRNHFGVSDAYSALDRLLTRRAGFAHRGDIVAMDRDAGSYTGVAMGICIGTTSAFVAPHGLVFVDTDTVKGAWF